MTFKQMDWLAGFIFGALFMVLICFLIIIRQSKTIQTLMMERDSLKTELAKRWPPSYLKYRPLKRDTIESV